MSTLLIKNGTVVTFGAPCKVLPEHSVLLENGIIKKIAKQENFEIKADKTIDATGKIIMPGIINAHMHFYSTLVRGLGKAKPSKNFQEVLENLWWRLDKKLTLDDTYYSTMVMLLHAIRCGTTTFIDHHASPFAIRRSLQKIAQALKETGLRGCLCYELSDRDGEKIASEGIEENVEFIKYCQKNRDDQLKALFGLHASFTITEKTLKKVADIGANLHTGFHVHTAEAVSDQDNTLKMCGKRVVERFHEYGILGKQTIAAHCVHITDHEMDLLAESDTMVVHNPQSNMNNAVGIADIIKMQQKGICVGLGTDAMTVNMFEEVRVAMWAQHLRAANPTAGFMEVTNTLFVNNAKIVNRIWDDAKLGVLAEGHAGDVIVVDYDPPTPFDENTVLGHLIFGYSQQAIVDTTIVKGKVLMENRKILLDIDEKKIFAESRSLAKKLWDRF